MIRRRELSTIRTAYFLDRESFTGKLDCCFDFYLLSGSGMLVNAYGMRANEAKMSKGDYKCFQISLPKIFAP